MATNPQVKVTLTADTGPYQRSMSQAATSTSKVEKASASMQTRTDKLAVSFRKQAAAYGASAIAFAGVVGVMRDSIMAATELQDSTSKIEVVFGSAAQSIVDFANDSTRSFGLSKRAAYDATSAFAIFGKAAGLSGKALSDWSIELAQRAVDLSSMFGGTVEEAVTAIGASLRGEQEPIRQYGALIDDMTLRQKAVEMGLISTVKQGLDPQNRALADAALLLDKTSIASGDYMNTIDGMANSLKEASKQWEDAKAAFGEAVLPAATAGTKAGAGGLTWVSRWFGDMSAGMAANVALLTGNAEAYDNAMARLRGSSESAAPAASGVGLALDYVRSSARGAAVEVAGLADATESAFTAMNNLINVQQAAASSSRDLLGASDRIRAGMVQTTTAATGAASARKSASEAADESTQKAIDAIRKRDAAEEEAEIKAARRAMQRRADARLDAQARKEVAKNIADAIAVDKRARAGKDIDGGKQTASVGEATGSLNKREAKELEAQIDAIRKRHQRAVDAQVKGYKSATTTASAAAGSVDVLSTSLNENTAAGRQNLDVLDGEIDRIQTAGETAYQAAMDTGLGAEKATRIQARVMKAARDDLVATYKEWGFATEAVEAYITKIGLVKKDIKTTVHVAVDTTELDAATKKANALKFNKYNVLPEPDSRPRVEPLKEWPKSPYFSFSTGGEVSGPGSTTSDSIPARLSRGEFVVRAQSYAANRELVQAINNGTGRVASGGLSIGQINVTESGSRVRQGVLDALAESAYRSGAVR